MLKINWLNVLVVTLLLLAALSSVTLAAPPKPPDELPLEQVAQVVLPGVDRAGRLNETEMRLAQGQPLRFAVAFPVAISPATHGTWETLADGKRQWRLRLVAPEAESLNLGFSRYVMPAGGELWITGLESTDSFGPFTAADNDAHKQLWTPLVRGAELVIIVKLPAEAASALELELAVVNHGYLDPFNPVHILSGSCNVDVACGTEDGYPEIDAWREQIRSVGAYSVNGVDTCSGALINNTAQDLTPYFLTADHCSVSSSNAASVVVYWNYENSYCRAPGSGSSGNPGDGSRAQFNSGAIFRADYVASDFTLLELDDPIDPAFNLHWAGWDRRDAATTSAVAIHHPGVEEKRISFENNATSITSYYGTPVPGNSTHIRVTDWDLGTTEGGSSGSPLFTPEHRIFGQLHGGDAACGNNSSDWYGRFFTSWTGGGTNATRLSNWLDPLGTGAVTLDGRDTAVIFTGILQGVVSSAGSGTPIAGAAVLAAGDYPTQTGSIDSLADGSYALELPVGRYSVAVSAYGYQPASIGNVDVLSGATTTQDFILADAPEYRLTGVVTDENMGWALYARVEATPLGQPAQAVWTDPWTGAYSLTIPGGFSHTLTVETWEGLPGYLPQSREINLSGAAVEDFALAVDIISCAAPGYSGGGLSEGFEGTFPPAGWSVYETGNTSGPGWQQGATGSSGSHGVPYSGNSYAWNNDDDL
ncbi:MAG TPA: carboxypeptidase-like regulatory domain-containing protein, partial [Anaerolineae bacterium]|nr:carboxypeptidase-like regulatory domain-containing protein [Anaerolineae bacterium]